MSKFDWLTLSPRERGKIIDELSVVISAAPNEQATKQLLERLLTPSEIIMIGRRVLIAERLIQRKNYAQIRSELKVGYSTILAVQNWLKRKQVLYTAKAAKGKKSQADSIYYPPAEFGSLGMVIGPVAARMGLLGLLIEGFLDIATPPKKNPLPKKK